MAIDIHEVRDGGGDDLQRRRALAEIRRIELQADEAERRLNAKWYSGRFFVEVIVGAIVASALLATWIMNYMQPILSKRQEIASLDAQLVSKQSEQQRIENAQRTALLERENKAARDQLVAMKAANDSLVKQQQATEKQATELRDKFESQSRELASLAQQASLTQEERQRINRLSKEADAQVATLQQQIENLKKQQAASAQRAESIETRLTASNLRDSVWKRDCAGCDQSSQLIYFMLRGDGTTGLNSDEPKDFAFDGTDSWKVVDGKLILSWTSGYSTDTYDFKTPTSTTAEGVKSNAGPVRITRVK